MSIENSLERIADALEKIATQHEATTQAVEYADVPDLDKTDPITNPPVTQNDDGTVETVKVPRKVKASDPEVLKPAPKAAPKKAPKKAPVTAREVAMTVEEVNAAIIVEFIRLGGRDKIDEVLLKYSDTKSISNIDATEYPRLLAEIKAL